MFKRFWITYPLLARLVIFLLLPLVLSLGVITLYLRQSLPASHPQKVLQTNGADVAILRSAEQVPTISSDKLADAYFGLGYVHAQDRLWQMETLRFLAKGRLAELKGQQALAADIYMRTLGFEILAKSQLDSISATTRTYLDAYTAGVNHWLESNGEKVLPVEYYISGHVPDRWTNLDSLVVFKLFQYEYSYGLSEELQFNVAANILGEQKARALFMQPGATEHEVEAYTNSATRIFSEKMLLVAQSISKEFGFGEKSLGDYAWASIFNDDGKITPVVGAVVNNKATLPAKFYIAQVRTSDLNLAGATIPGLPLFFHGRNDDIAWSFVPVSDDVQDLYVEKISPRDDDTYQFSGQWLPIKKRTETFLVKGDYPQILRGNIAPVTLTVRETVNGPIISDAVNNSGSTLALKWVGMDVNDKSIESFFKLNFSHNKQDLLDSFAAYTSPLINLVVADKHGGAGKKIVGSLPVRRVTNHHLPVAGWDPHYQWNGYAQVDVEKWAAPGETVIAVAGAANNQITIDSNKVLGNANNINMAAADTHSTFANIPALDNPDNTMALNIITRVNALARSNPDDSNVKVNVLLERLAGWDGKAGLDPVQQTIYYTLLRHLYQQLVSDELSAANYTSSVNPHVQQLLLNNVNPLFVYQSLVGSENWCDVVSTQKIETCADLVANSLQRSSNELTLLFGKNPEKWSWEHVGVLAYQHSFFGGSSSYAMFFNKNFELKNNVQSTGTNVPLFSLDYGYVSATDKTYSQLINLGTNAGWFYMSTGQSGNIFDSDYAKPVYFNVAFK